LYGKSEIAIDFRSYYYTKKNDRFNSTQQYENHRSFSSSGAL